MTKSRIAWTERVWNPVTGCTKVSAGCKNCYAERIAHRYWGERKFTDVQTHPDRLDAPLHWRKPSRVFVNSMSDLFHEDVPDEFIAQIFGVMARATRHTFQVLTKRPERMETLMIDGDWKRRVLVDAGISPPENWDSQEFANRDWLCGNVWLGVSVENQEQAEKRIPSLLQTPAAVLWLSVEPMLGPVNFGLDLKTLKIGLEIYRGVDWVVVGGESGHGFRPMEIKWLESVVGQCRESCIPVFVKQDSGLRPGQQGRIPNHLWIKQYPEATHELR